ncbi:hypothetical protein AYI69_g2714 [Smittium culicis]|uniref:Uncharacterized protein n=1 Tax=Smittium culicis TaxID=133412 RepID=A0A1R1YLZ0_9FUNG|nr:hypothetical protein AYI69_g2714 [Smittium culicis]
MIFSGGAARSLSQTVNNAGFVQKQIVVADELEVSYKPLIEHAGGADLGQSEKRAHKFRSFGVFDLVEREVVARDDVLATREIGPDQLGAFVLVVHLLQAGLVELQVAHQQLDLAHAPRISAQARIELLQIGLRKLAQTRRRVRPDSRAPYRC